MDFTLDESIYDHDCAKCKLHRSVDFDGEVCEPGYGPLKASIMVVGKMPNSPRYREAIEQDLQSAGVDIKQVWWASALKCRNFEDNASNLDVKTCRDYLAKEVAAVRPKYILTMGNEALLSVTGHSGITKWRGKTLEASALGSDTIVVPTISPAAVLARPQNKPGYLADLQLFGRLISGVDSDIVPPDYATVDTMTKLHDLKADLAEATLLSFDIESNIVPLQELDPSARMISISGTYIVPDETPRKLVVRGFAIPLYHPESVWRAKWRAVLKFLAPELQAIPKRIAHNGKFDSRWMRQFGVPGMFNTFDTMLAVHLLDENVVKALKPQASMRLGVAPWGVDTKNLLNMPIREVLEYNFLDTYYTYLIYLQVREELIEQPRLLRIFTKLMMPSSINLIDVERRGVWLDMGRLRERKPIAEAKLISIEDKIKAYLPPLGPEDTGWPLNAKGKPLEVNFNASNFARWMLFDYIKLPVLSRGKEKPDGSPGQPSMAEGVLLELREKRDQHPVVQHMLDRVEWQKAISSFFNAYDNLHDANDRVHTSFKLYGAVTGRLSSGKDDTSKMSGSTSKLRGVNLQQVPRDPFIRGLFGSTPGYTWIEADFSQVELRIAAFCAHERHMIKLYNEGADIHMITAMGMTGKAAKNVTKEERKKAKPVNFGFLYGMGWSKFILTAFLKYGIKFSEAEARAYRSAFFNLYPDLLRWHERQRRLVRAYGRVQSPIGRVRHLPDIYSPEQGVRAEAERQAINSPVQGLASDMALAGMNLIIQRLDERGLGQHAHCLGLVHDAVNFEARDDVVKEVLPIIKDSMEDMGNMRRKFGLVMTLPIIADLKVGRHWGDSVELTPEQVYDFPGLSKVGVK